MSRSRGRGPKRKPRADNQPASRTAQPFMMFQVFDRHPWMAVKWDPGAAPRGLDGNSMVRELVGVIQRHIAKAGEHSDKVKVSGVPYDVSAGDFRHGREPESESRPEYPY